MSIGKIIRKILGKRIFPIIGRSYRSIFVDLKTVASIMSEIIPSNSHILDIGGGDGEPINKLLSIRQDINVTMIDLSPSVGNALNNELKDRVKVFPQTSVREYSEKHFVPFNIIIISDVIHHVPVNERNNFFTDIHILSKMVDHPISVIIKDIEPRGFISKLSLFSDKYISGDKKTSLISFRNLKLQLQNIFGDVSFIDTDLYKRNRPNYAFSFITRK